MVPSLLLLSVALSGSTPLSELQFSVRTSEELQHIEALARFGTAHYYQKQNRLIQTERQLRVASKFEPEAMAPKRELAKLYARTGRDPSALRLAKEVVEANPGDLEIARLLAKLLMEAKRSKEAIDAYKLAVQSKEPLKLTDRILLWNDYAKAALDAKDGTSAVAAQKGLLKLLEDHKSELIETKLFDEVAYTAELSHQLKLLGEAETLARNFDKAEQAFSKALSLSEKTASAKLLRGQLHWSRCNAFAEQGKFNEALEELRVYLAAKPKGFEPYAKFVTLARQQRDLQSQLVDIAISNPENTAPLWLLASVKMNAGELTEAKAEFRKLLPKMTKPEEAAVLVEAYLSAQLHEGLLELLDKQLKAARPDGFDNPDRDREKELEDARPETVVRVRLLSTAVRSATKSEISLLVKALAEQTSVGTKFGADVYELLFNCARSPSDLLSFARMLPRAVTNQPKDIRLKFLAVQALETNRQWADLARQADELSRAEMGRYYPVIKAKAAVAKAELGQGNAAHAILDDLGDTPYTMSYRVNVYNILGNHREALKLCDAILEMDKLTEQVVFNTKKQKAQCLILIGQQTENEKLLRALLDDHPDDPVLLNTLGYNLADQNRKLPEAEKLLQRAMELDKDERRRSGDFDSVSGSILDSQAWLLFRKKQFKAAREALELAVETTEEARSPIAWDHLGDVYFELNDRKAAVKAWQKAQGYYENSHLGRDFDRLNSVKAKIKMFE